MNAAKMGSFGNNQRSFQNSSNIVKKQQNSNHAANALRFRRQFITQKNAQAAAPNGLSIQTGQQGQHPGHSSNQRDISNQRENHRLVNNNRGGPQQVKQLTNSQNTRTNNPLVKQQLSPSSGVQSNNQKAPR
jgi:hypothetical protein